MRCCCGRPAKGKAFICHYPGSTLPPWLGYYPVSRPTVSVAHNALDIVLLDGTVVSAQPDRFHTSVPYPEGYERCFHLAKQGIDGVSEQQNYTLYSAPVYRNGSTDIVGVLFGRRKASDNYRFQFPTGKHKRRTPKERDRLTIQALINRERFDEEPNGERKAGDEPAGVSKGRKLGAV